MKTEESRIPIKHEHEHAVPTVIHDPDADMPQLRRWLTHAMENPVQFWGGVAAVVVVLAAASLMAGGMSLGRAASDEAWTKLETAKTPAERVEIAREFPKTQAERWALLQAAGEYYNQGFNDLPSNRDVALPTLKKALDTFEKVASESPEDSPQARAAALGVARTLEARNDLDRALKQYEKVAATKAWAGTPEAREAARLAAVLKKPETAAFYKELYAYKPTEAVLPPGGTGALDIPMPPFGGSGSGSATPPITIPDIPIGKAATPAAGAGSSPTTLPDLSNLPPPPPQPTAAPKVEEPKGKTIDLTPPAAAPKAKDGEIPADPFTPAKSGDGAPKK